MSYNNYGPPPGAFGQRQPSYSSQPPNFGPPPGTGAAPGVSQSPGGMQNSQFQPPPNMPFNVNAPIIRLGMQDQQGGGRPGSSPGDRSYGREGRGSNAEPLGGGRGGRSGLGFGGDRNLDRERAAVRESMMALQPPTREEVARTIFIGGLGDGAPDDAAIEDVLRCAGKLRRWTRAKDADDRACKFGFAEYEDVESLEAANEIYKNIEVPLFRNGAVVKDEGGEVKKMKLLVVVDEQSKNYINEWKGKRREDDDARQFRIDGCKDDLRSTLAGLINAGAYLANGMPNGADGDGDVSMGEANGDKSGENAEVVNIPLNNLEDELSDIPQEMRATVAEEIKAFRDRSNRRDMERLRREEAIEEQERQRSGGGRVNRLASPPPSGAPSGPASASNGVPVGPRGAVQGAPSGPRGYRGAQMPNDYVNGVSFVGANGAISGIAINREDEDAEESDEELERRRKAKRDSELEKQYLDAERRLQNRERARAAAQEREKVREEATNRDREKEKDVIAKRLREWDDEEEARKGREEYYYDRSMWIRKRNTYRDREQRDDDRDRAAEERERADERKKNTEARGLADDFLNQTGAEIQQKAIKQESADQAAAGAGFGGFKMSLGTAANAQRKQAASAAASAPPKRAMADVEGLLEDEEDAANAGLKRPELKPITDTSTAPMRGVDMSDEERAEARRQIASEIPTSAADLFSYPVKFNFLTSEILKEQIRPFVERKVVEYLGVQEDLLVQTVMDGLNEGKSGKGGREVVDGVVSELKEVLDEEEAEGLVRKVWRMVGFWTECEARGLTG